MTFFPKIFYLLFKIIIHYISFQVAGPFPIRLALAEKKNLPSRSRPLELFVTNVSSLQEILRAHVAVCRIHGPCRGKAEGGRVLLNPGRG
ncbi:hypothetical protein MPTK1_3g00220 [Marchantia polymorpha subsp. ruderalis]|uniref:Uncharacterized protein n=1 Tax=Marchantia polymorpha subsp. ruderalis TaxID=1480154 RepID=A0AAF6AVT7_MARPO|nr:hypothetical protein Mp_3g00220 [Marchantia polymorpha subsp. ruderalis]